MKKKDGDLTKQWVTLKMILVMREENKLNTNEEIRIKMEIYK